MSVTAAPPTAEPGVATPAGPRRFPWPWYGLALLGAWLIPVATHLLRVDLVLVPLVIVATASVLRTGGTLLDRLMLALFLDAATAIAGGIGFTFWPWGFQPIAVAGCALTGIVGYSALTGTPPRLPRRFSGADLAVVGTWIAASYIAAAPFLRAKGSDRIAYALINNDRLHHYNLFDSIRSIGGYTMLNFEPVRNQVADGMGRNYPPAAHYLYALLDSFTMSGRPAGDPIHEVDRYFLYVALGSGFLAASIVWGAKWVAGPAVRGWPATLVASAIGTIAATGFLTTLVWEGFDSEIIGLAFLALTIAVLLRPAKGVVTQAVFVGAGVASVSFSYTLMLLFVVPAVVVVGVTRRRELRNHWRPLLVIALVAGAVAALPVIMPRLNTGFTGTSMILFGGFVARTSRTLLYSLVALGFAGILLSRTARRSQVVRMTALTLGFGVLAAIGLWQYMETHAGGGYYFEKAVHGLFIVALVCLGPVAFTFRRDAFGGLRPATRGRIWKNSAAGAAALLAGVLISGGITWGKTVYNRDLLTPGPDTTWAKVWDGGDVYVAPYANTVDRLVKDGYINGAGGKPTMILLDDNAGINESLSLIAATLNRNMGMVVMQVTLWESTHHLVDLPATGPLPEKSQHSLQILEDTIKSAPVPMRIVVADPRLVSILRDFATQNPATQLEVIQYHG